ncbi:helix-turn-helix domain-containing protein [Ruthenibacterium lactatiformans]|uniref:helix-turn-helix domain-containing protein n=1 Tax=Ruthenibacterium lactatiformans TaxID=1550024 RepID=UPI002670FD94|nr:helix-turn-helix transcriptional regulator [Ruthenibacterium lactatiformans]
MSDITVALGKKIRSLRQARGWTQEQLAEYADLHVSYIVLLEKGANRATIETLEKLAKASLIWYTPWTMHRMIQYKNKCVS